MSPSPAAITMIPSSPARLQCDRRPCPATKRTQRRRERVITTGILPIFDAQPKPVEQSDL